MAAKNKFLNAMKMPSIDDMFSSEADRQRESGDLVTEVPLSELHPFVGHPFEVRDDEDMQKLVDSIRENGVLTNLTVRRRTEGGYEIISGHRRFHAAQRAGLDSVKVQVRDIDDDQAIIDMVDSNIQREHISPMEKARAYAMRLDAAQRKRGRPSKENYSQVGNNFGTRTSSDELSEKVGESKNQIFRYVRLNCLVPDLQKKVDDGSLKFNPAVELSYLTPTEQNDFLDYIESQSCSPSLSQAQKLKAASKDAGNHGHQKAQCTAPRPYADHQRQQNCPLLPHRLHTRTDGRNHHAASGTKLPPSYAGKTTQSGALKWQSTDIA